MFFNKKRKFDLVLSIGHRCFTSLMLRQNNLQVASFPFDWLLNIEYKQSLEFLCNNFENFLNKDDLELVEIEGNEFHNTYKNKRNNFSLVHDFPVNIDFDKQFEIVKAKYSKRSERLVEKIKKSKNVLFVYSSSDVYPIKKPLEEVINDTKTMLPKLKEVFPATEFSFMYICPSDNKGFYYLNNDLNLEFIEKSSEEGHKKVKFLGIRFSIKTNMAPEILQNCSLNKSFKEKIDNVIYLFGKYGRRLLPKKLKSYFAEKKY